WYFVHFFFFSSRRRHTRFSRDWSSDVCSSDLQRRTGVPEAIITGTGAIEGRGTVVGAMEFGFLGGSMGAVVGEKVARSAERAGEDRKSVVLFSASGGARMQGGALSLMQLAKTSVAGGLPSEPC